MICGPNCPPHEEYIEWENGRLLGRCKKGGCSYTKDYTPSQEKKGLLDPCGRRGTGRKSSGGRKKKGSGGLKTL